MYACDLYMWAYFGYVDEDPTFWYGVQGLTLGYGLMGLLFGMYSPHICGTVPWVLSVWARQSPRLRSVCVWQGKESSVWEFHLLCVPFIYKGFKRFFFFLNYCYTGPYRNFQHIRQVKQHWICSLEHCVCLVLLKSTFVLNNQISFNPCQKGLAKLLICISPVLQQGWWQRKVHQSSKNSLTLVQWKDSPLMRIIILLSLTNRLVTRPCMVQICWFSGLYTLKVRKFESTLVQHSVFRSMTYWHTGMFRKGENIWKLNRTYLW